MRVEQHLVQVSHLGPPGRQPPRGQPWSKCDAIDLHSTGACVDKRCEALRRQAQARLRQVRGARAAAAAILSLQPFPGWVCGQPSRPCHPPVTTGCCSHGSEARWRWHRHPAGRAQPRPPPPCAHTPPRRVMDPAGPGPLARRPPPAASGRPGCCCPRQTARSCGGRGGGSTE